jgi:GGDEF domain-containing protein
MRIGGDEFLVLLAGEELERALHNTRLPGLSVPVDLSVAWGVAEYRDRADLAAAVDRADAAMYASKQARKGARRTRAG